ncbi:MAG: hypothetical protein WC307_00795 [Candidatus Nanoarchaeia archaeon]
MDYLKKLGFKRTLNKNKQSNLDLILSNMIFSHNKSVDVDSAVSLIMPEKYLSYLLSDYDKLCEFNDIAVKYVNNLMNIENISQEGNNYSTTINCDNLKTDLGVAIEHVKGCPTYWQLFDLYKDHLSNNKVTSILEQEQLMASKSAQRLVSIPY